jgi:hypothetical protein
MKTALRSSFVPRFHHNNPSPIRCPGKNRIQRRWRQSIGENVFYEFVEKLAQSVQADNVAMGVLWAGAAPEDPDRVNLTKILADPLFSAIPSRGRQALQATFLGLEELWAQRGENPQKALATLDFSPRVLSGMGLGIWHWARQFGSEP